MADTDPMQRDAIQVLTHDHDEVKELFAQLEALQARAAAGEALLDERRDLLDRVIIELVRHSVAEEEHLYPTAKRVIPGAEQMVEEEIAEHAEAEKVMNELDGMSPDNIEFGSKLRTLIADVRHHIEEEETKLFPLLRQYADASDLRDLGAAIESAKKLAPTRPHPAAPDRPPFNKLLAPGAALVDRLRDTLTRRGKS